MSPKHPVARPEDVEANLSVAQTLARPKTPSNFALFDVGRESPRRGVLYHLARRRLRGVAWHKRCPSYIRGVQGAVTSDDTRRRRRARTRRMGREDQKESQMLSHQSWVMTVLAVLGAGQAPSVQADP